MNPVGFPLSRQVPRSARPHEPHAVFQAETLSGKPVTGATAGQHRLGETWSAAGERRTGSKAWSRGGVLRDVAGWVNRT
jgi:hypothetical protein